MLMFLRISLWLFSFWGLQKGIQRLGKIDSQLSYFFTACSIILCLYFGAYLQALAIVAYFLLISGILLGILAFLDRKNTMLITFSVESSLLFIYFMILVSVLWKTNLVHYDNFSHWATIVKFLVTQNRLPDSMDTIISFTSYPMGSALFLYYTTKFIGYYEPILLISQAFLIFTCFYAFFACLKDRTRTLFIMILFTGIVSFNYFNIAIRMDNLLVDFLLPIIALASISGLSVLRSRPIMQAIYFVATVGVLGIIKNSAIFFVILVAGYYLYLHLTKESTCSTRTYTVLHFLLPVIAAVLPSRLWSWHVSHHFTQSKHQVNLSEYQQLFQEKDASIRSTIHEKFLHTVFSFDTLSTQGIILTFALLIISYFVIRLYLKRQTHLLRWIVIEALIVIFYYLGIYAMFLFSMPTQEAIVLAGFERYASSIVFFCLGSSLFVLIRTFDDLLYEPVFAKRTYRSFASLKSKQLYQISTLLLVFCSLLLILSETNGILFTNKTYDTTIPGQFQAINADTMELNQSRYLVVSADKSSVDSYLVQSVGKYTLFSPNVEARENFIMDDKEFNALLSQYDYIVLLDDHYTFNKMIEKLINHPLQPGVYPVTKLLTK
ncbi:hypothetical protein [Enterococcus sp. AZ102]|uniref:hypothetical protein n=1 Tax=Enterococcus sp. AZ102 TaxID=2774865 RepID=UPI003F2343FB